MSPTNQQQRRLSRTDAVIQLLDLDYSTIVGATPGDPSFILKFSPSLGHDNLPVRVGGVEYSHVDVKMDGWQRRAEGAQPRPRISVGNRGAVFSSLAASAGDLLGATLLRRRIFAEHIDSGESPDTSKMWEDGEVWIVSRKLNSDPYSLDFELRAPADVQSAKIPSGIVERTRCRWVYRDTRCGWVREAGLLFLRNGAGTVVVDDDDCGLRVGDCAKRFAAKGDALRFGGLPAAGRSLR